LSPDYHKRAPSLLSWPHLRGPLQSEPEFTHFARIFLRPLQGLPDFAGSAPGLLALGYYPSPLRALWWCAEFVAAKFDLDRSRILPHLQAGSGHDWGIGGEKIPTPVSEPAPKADSSMLCPGRVRGPADRGTTKKHRKPSSARGLMPWKGIRQ